MAKNSVTAPLRRSWLRQLAALGLMTWWPLGQAQTSPASAAGPLGSAGSGVGTADFVGGQVSVTRDGVATVAQAGMPLRPGDLVETARGAELHAKFEDGGYLVVRAGSAVRIDQYVAQGEPSDVVALNLLRGALRSVTGWIGKIGTPDRYRITTATATVGVRGTDHEVLVVPEAQASEALPAGTHNRVIDGATTLKTELGEVEIPRGAAGHSAGGREPPRLHAAVPTLFNRLRSPNESRLALHKRSQREFMEAHLRQRGKLSEGQEFRHFIERHRPTSPAPNKESAASRETSSTRHQVERDHARRQQVMPHPRRRD